MTPRPAQSLLIALLVLTGIAAVATSPLTNVDVVLMTARGMPEKEIIHTIRAAPATAFDLEPDMVVELLRAGVAQSVVDVMLEVQPRRGAEAGPEESDSLLLEVRFPEKDPGHPEKNTTSLPAKDEDGRKISILFFVACRAPTHVPDLWQTKTPLVEGFQRHRLVGVVDSNASTQEKKRSLVYLDLPQRVEMEIPPGPHHLLVGVAGRFGEDDWFPLASDETTIDMRPGEPAFMEITLSTRGLKWLGRKSIRSPLHTVKILAVSPPLEAPSP